MDQHPYYGAALLVAIPIGLYYSLRAAAEALRLMDYIRARRDFNRHVQAALREQAALRAKSDAILARALDLGDPFE